MDLNHIPQSLRDQISPELLDQLAQELNKPVYGPKSVERHMPALCRKAAAEGAVLLKNEGVLPLAPEQPVAVFGRVQLDWFYVGYGSGGDVNPPYRVNLMEGAAQCGRGGGRRAGADVCRLVCGKRAVPRRVGPLAALL